MAKTKTNEMSDFETLLIKNDIRYADRWVPTYVDPFKTIVSQGVLENIQDNIKNNIAYNLQYIQFLQLQIDELKLHSIITSQIYKTYIITAMAIIEAVFHQVLKNSGKWTMTEWELIRKVPTNEFEEDGQKKRVEVYLQQRIEPREVEMDFNTIINKIQEKKLLDLENKHFPDIKKLKSLRNRVHLQIGNSVAETDYYKFVKSDYNLARTTLYCVLTDSKILVNRTYLKYLDFLKKV